MYNVISVTNLRHTVQLNLLGCRSIYQQQFSCAVGLGKNFHFLSQGLCLWITRIDKLEYFILTFTHHFSHTCIICLSSAYFLSSKSSHVHIELSLELSFCFSSLSAYWLWLCGLALHIKKVVQSWQQSMVRTSYWDSPSPRHIYLSKPGLDNRLFGWLDS